ncbi:MAG: uroporphyrinogen decarboxylase [Planctomycetes bacterium]|nr:uroporphyrinogen decarboxylase [Planctomycetota bacterium]
MGTENLQAPEGSPSSVPPRGPAPLERFLAAARGRNRGRPPVWLMRQAGRYLPEYRAIRGRRSFKEMCQDPDLAVEVSLLPHRLLGVDAVIVFYDILIPLEGMGMPLQYTDEGPVFTDPVRDEGALCRLRPLEPEHHTASILTAIRRLKEELGAEKPVLGFAGGPFTLASYLVEGRPGMGVEAVKRILFQAPAFLHRLLERLAEMTAAYLKAQVRAGADAVQLFDTWAGQLGKEEYREFVLPYQRWIFRELGDLNGAIDRQALLSRDGDGYFRDSASAALCSGDPRDGDKRHAPAILFVKDGNHVLEEMAGSGAQVLSLDWRSSLDGARERLGAGIALQGNLDPAALFAPVEAVRRRVGEMLAGRQGDPAYIFNLGHGLLPETPVDSVQAVVETVKSFGS